MFNVWEDESHIKLRKTNYSLTVPRNYCTVEHLCEFIRMFKYDGIGVLLNFDDTIHRHIRWKDKDSRLCTI